MKLHIFHRTTYRYSRAVTLQPHRLIVRPRGSHQINILSTSLRCSPEAAIDWSQDVFGNLIATASFAAPTAELVITNEADVEHCADDWPVFSIDPEAHGYPFEYSAGERRDLGPLRASIDGGPGGTVDNWVRAFVMGPRTDTLALLKDINAGILGPIYYRTRDEEGTQTPEETLRLGSGSCRDIAALFIDGVRHLGFAARAVSGYLYDPDLPADDAGSTHAWAEVYLPGAGWIAFDPTHRRAGEANLIAVAVGHDNGQIMPVSGGYLGDPDDAASLIVEVRVTALS